jgi:hypothetical protein
MPSSGAGERLGTDQALALQIDLWLVPDFQPVVPQCLVGIDPCRTVGPRGKTGAFLAPGVVGELGGNPSIVTRVAAHEPLLGEGCSCPWADRRNLLSNGIRRQSRIPPESTVRREGRRVIVSPESRGRTANVSMNDRASDDAKGRIINFRPRVRAFAGANKASSPRDLDAASPVSDLAKFEQGREHDDYRHRMIVNAVALAFTLVLAAAGIWIAESMATMRKNQDCALMGRKNCSPIAVPTGDRWSGNVSDRR